MWGLLLIATITDILALSNAVLSGQIVWPAYLAIHLALTAGLYAFYRWVAKETLEMPLELMVLVPGAGLLFTWILYTMLLGFNRSGRMIEDYERYIHYIQEYVLEKNVDLHHELDTTSALDRLAQGVEEQKKNVIIDMIDEDLDVKVAVLKRALQDENPEVVHYASTTLQLVDKEYERQMDHLKNRIEEDADDASSRRELIDLYHRYVKSGLVSGELNAYYLRELIEMVDAYLDRYGEDLVLYTRKMDALIGLKAYPSIYEVLGKAYQAFPQHWSNFYYTLQALHYTGRYKEIPGVIRKVRELEIKVPEEHLPLLAFWEQEGNR